MLYFLCNSLSTLINLERKPVVVHWTHGRNRIEIVSFDIGIFGEGRASSRLLFQWLLKIWSCSTVIELSLLVFLWYDHSFYEALTIWLVVRLNVLVGFYLVLFCSSAYDLVGSTVGTKAHPTMSSPVLLLLRTNCYLADM